MNRVKYSLSLFVKVFVKAYFLRVYKVNYVFGDIELNKKEPFFLIGNHVLLLDALFSCFAIDGYAVPVVNSFIYTNKIQRLALTKMADSIVKRKGQSDIQTIKEIRRYLKNGRPIALYPEGNSSYFGETIDSVYATAKLLKLQKVKVVCIKTKGGYFAKPRWRDKRIKRAYIELEKFLLFSAQDINDLSVEDIYQKMIKAYYQNDYDWNRLEQIKYIGKNRLEGSHRVIYGCPECDSINKIGSKGDYIHCNNCDSTGHINTKFDNFVDWGRYQEDLLKSNLDLNFFVDIEIFRYDLKIFKRYKLGKAKLIYSNGVFLVSSETFSNEFIIKDIRGEVYSEALDFSFDYKDETFMFRSERPKLLLDLTKLNKEE